jgi:hypothetical protein
MTYHLSEPWYRIVQTTANAGSYLIIDCNDTRYFLHRHQNTIKYKTISTESIHIQGS